MMPGYSGPIASRKRANITDDSHELYGIHGNHPAIITSEIFDKVQEEKKYRSNIEAGETGLNAKSPSIVSKEKDFACFKK